MRKSTEFIITGLQIMSEAIGLALLIGTLIGILYLAGLLIEPHREDINNFTEELFTPE